VRRPGACRSRSVAASSAGRNISVAASVHCSQPITVALSMKVQAPVSAGTGDSPSVRRNQ
jgi:hypothetical protein